MSQESSHDFKFKRDLSHVFDSVHSYHLRNKCKKRNKLIRVYTGYITSTGAMGHSGIIQGGNFNCKFKSLKVNKIYLIQLLLIFDY